MILAKLSLGNNFFLRKKHKNVLNYIEIREKGILEILRNLNKEMKTLLCLLLRFTISSIFKTVLNPFSAKRVVSIIYL